ncbi:ATP phosphoribosyltransferase regulatory subunit [Streptococcus suis]|uniref:ATP phosphoribosyltransferase regulatory subunit n=1 Tax=Streptococcus suis TaxID=1307 RepID=UPI0014781F21
MNNRTLPQGLHDKLFKRARATYEIERTVSDLLIERGFHRIETPTLEHFEVFSDTVDTNNYHLFDKRGHLLSLRPDITSQVARVIASTRVQTPIKFSYSGKVFRSQEAMRGLENERTQAGIEIIGYPVQEAYAEAISSAKQALERSGLKDYKFEFSHAAILKTIFQQLELTSEVADDLSLHIRDKNITKLHEFTKQHPSEFDGFISRLPYLFGEAEAVLAEARQVSQNAQLLQAFDQLEAFIAMAEIDLGPVTVDLAQLPTVPYYTGMMFKVFDQQLPDAFLSGGRYDKLFERFGAKELTAIGWALEIDAIYQAIRQDLDYQGGK